MRCCTRCNIEMEENYNLNVQGKLYGVSVTKSEPNKIFKKTEKIKVAICPKCGHIELYVDPESITKIGSPKNIV